MPNTPIGDMLQAWQRHSIEYTDKEEFPVKVPRTDIVRLKALSEVYRLPIEEVVANLISNALNEVETRMPYVPGPTVIRVEEGEPVYEDVGLTPTYLAVRKRIEEEMAAAPAD